MVSFRSKPGMLISAVLVRLDFEKIHDLRIGELANACHKRPREGAGFTFRELADEQSHLSAIASRRQRDRVGYR